MLPDPQKLMLAVRELVAGHASIEAFSPDPQARDLSTAALNKAVELAPDLFGKPVAQVREGMAQALAATTVTPEAPAAPAAGLAVVPTEPAPK